MEESQESSQASNPISSGSDTDKTLTKYSKPPYSKYGGRYCCVVGCSNNQGRDGQRGVRFHQFPINRRRRDEWIQAVKRESQGGVLWKPGCYDVICSEHFYGGKKSNVVGDPAYIPSVFPTHHHRSKTKADEERFRRHEKFQAVRQKVCTKKVVNLLAK